MASGTFDIIHPGHAFYLKEAKKLGGNNSILMVVVATDKTVQNHKRVPIIPQEQRCEMISMLKYVDEAYVGDEDDPFKIVKEKNPDIIAIGSDQNFNPVTLHKSLLKEGLNIKVVKIQEYKKFELDSTCKIIRKIKNTHFNEKSMQNCE